MLGVAALLLLFFFMAQDAQAQCPSALRATVDWTNESVPTSTGTAVLSYTATVNVGSGPTTTDVTVSLSPSACFSEQLWKRTETNAHGTGSEALNYKTDDALTGCANSSTITYTFDEPFGVSQLNFSVLDIDDDNGSVWDDIITITATDGTNTYTPNSSGSSYSITNTTYVNYNSGSNQFFIPTQDLGNVGNTANNGNISISMANNAGQGITSVSIVHTPQGDGRIGLGDINFCVDAPLPVELTSFDATVDGSDVLLRWETATETNNAGFYVEMARQDQSFSGTLEKDFEQLGFVEGFGTTERPQSYQHRVSALDPGAYTFRLKQVDYDGTFEYHPEVEALVEVPTSHFLSEAYPNPFNPQAQFRLSVGQRQTVQVEVYNSLGQMVDHLYQGTMEADVTRTFTIDGSTLPSGMYIYRVIGETFNASRPVLLVK